MHYCIGEVLVASWLSLSRSADESRHFSSLLLPSVSGPSSCIAAVPDVPSDGSQQCNFFRQILIRESQARRLYLLRFGGVQGCSFVRFSLCAKVKQILFKSKQS